MQRFFFDNMFKPQKNINRQKTSAQKKPLQVVLFNIWNIWDNRKDLSRLVLRLITILLFYNEMKWECVWLDSFALVNFLNKNVVFFRTFFVKFFCVNLILSSIGSIEKYILESKEKLIKFVSFDWNKEKKNNSVLKSFSLLCQKSFSMFST
jgi:hypothetical protein